jgi:2-iminobutanoate/2-iminopropanoate deaminase
MDVQYGFPQSTAIRAGDYIFVSGITSIDAQSGERIHGTVTSETHRVFQNLKLVLESAGSSLDRLVQVHAMIYDRIEYDVLNRVYRQYVPSGPPARTVWSVQIGFGFKVQLDAIAVV